MSLSYPFLQSVILILAEISITALAIGFTSAFSTPIRSFGFSLVIASAYIAFQLIIHHIPITLWANVLAGNASTYTLRYLELVLIDRWSFEYGGPSPTRPESSSSDERELKRVVKSKERILPFQPPTVWRRLRFGFSVTLNPRLVNTAYQVKNVPRWSEGEPQRIPSRGQFLRHTAFVVFLSYLAVDLCSLGAQPERNIILFSDEKIAFFERWNHLSLEEFVIRVSASLVLWLNIYCIFRIFHGLVVLLTVGSGFSKVEDWPPPFGPLSEAYSIRQFWGVFWHQNYRGTFGGPAQFFVDDFLRLPQNTLVARYARLFTTFCISGVLHMSADVAAGMAFGESGSIRFFCTQAVGILLEDSVQALCQYVVPVSGGTKASRREKVAELIGKVWLGAFLAWSTPVWAYPAMRRNQGRAEDIVLPFSIVKAFF